MQKRIRKIIPKDTSRSRYCVHFLTEYEPYHFGAACGGWGTYTEDTQKTTCPECKETWEYVEAGIAKSGK